VRQDIFPSTQRTWIEVTLGQTGKDRLEVNRHVMSLYAHPLRVYFLGTSVRWLGDADDVVAGFFADRLARDDFFADWKRSGLRLRRWLMNAFSFYLSEQLRQRKRDRRMTGPIPELGTLGASPERLLDRAFGQSIVGEALKSAQAECASKTLTEHWGIFVRHAYDGLPYEQIGPAFGVTPERAAVMARTAARHFRRALRDLLQADGASEIDADNEIKDLLAAVES
jgi:DNA-directed RNA polymerase specialized sigma24 family protein